MTAADYTPSIAALACTCAGGTKDSACTTCRAWHGVRAAVEHASAIARRQAYRPDARLRRLEQRMRAVEDALIAEGIFE